MYNRVRSNIRNLLVGATVREALEFRRGRIGDGRWKEAEYADEFIRELEAEKPVLSKTARIPVNSILIPVRFVRVASEWYGGQSCKLYAVTSTGNLTTGTHRPAEYRADDGNEKWYYHIWRELSVDVGLAVEAARAGVDASKDATVLVEFAEFVDATVSQLAESYGIED